MSTSGGQTACVHTAPREICENGAVTSRIGSALLAGSLLFVAACGGGSDGDSSSTSTTDASTATPVVTAAPITTPAVVTTTTVPMVVEGATVIVANGNIIGGSAGRMSDALGLEGFTMGTPVNGTEKIEESVVYHVDDATAEAVAQTLAGKLGGVTVEALPETAPIEGDFVGDVLLLLGNVQADKTIAQLSGVAATGDVEAVSNAGSTVVVANGSGVSGSAGRMSDLLKAAGFTVGTPTNSTAQATESVIYYASDDAKADADALAAAMGGLTVLALPDDVPTDAGTLDGDILLVLGTKEADKTLAELAG